MALSQGWICINRAHLGHKEVSLIEGVSLRQGVAFMRGSTVVTTRMCTISVMYNRNVESTTITTICIKKSGGYSTNGGGIVSTQYIKPIVYNQEVDIMYLVQGGYKPCWNTHTSYYGINISVQSYHNGQDWGENNHHHSLYYKECTLNKITLDYRV